MGIKIEELQAVDAKYFQARLVERMQAEMFPGNDISLEFKRLDNHLSRLRSKLIKHQHVPYFTLGMARALDLPELEIRLIEIILDNFESERGNPDLLAAKQKALDRMKENGEGLIRIAEKLQEKNGYRWL